MTTRLLARVLAVLAVLFALATPARADDVTAVGDQATTPVAQAVQIDVLANDQGTQLTAAITTVPTNGNAAVNVDNTITYTPNQGFRGTDSFQYEASDGDGDTSAPASVDLIVDDPPVANDDFPTVVKNTSLSPQDVLGNDTDPNGDQLSVASVSAPGFGTTQAGNTSVLYTPDPGYTGPDSFTYKASDGLLDSQEATVTVTVIEGVATATDDSYDVNQGQTLTVDSTAGVLANDGDLDGDTLSAVLDDSNPDLLHGALTSGLDADGSFTYVPASDFFGNASFTYHADDGNGGASASATVTIHVNGIPVAAGDSIATDEGTPAQVGVLGNDLDPDHDALTVSGTTDGTNGTVTHDATTVTYTPSVASFQGTDSFTYTVADTHGATDTATVDVVVDDPPVGSADSYSVGKNATLTVDAPGVLGNDTDADQADVVTASAGTLPAHGSLTLAPDGSFTYTPTAGFTGPDSFTYVPNDGLRDGQAVTVSINVTEGAPVAVDHSLTTSAGTGKAVDLLAGVSDPDGDAVAVKSIGQPAGHTGTVVNNKDGTATYTPAAGVCNATDLFAYTVGDGHGATDSANVSVTVKTQRTSTAITLTPSATVLPFGGGVTLTIHLGRFVSGEKVTFTRIPFGQAARPVGSATVDSHGNAHLTVNGLQLGSTFRASSPQENCFLAGTSQGSFVAVRANVTGHMAGAYALRNGYALYHDGTAPLFRGAVAPNHAGQSVTFQWQQNSGKGWQPYLSQAQGLDSNSRIAVFLSSGAVKGPAYRVRIVWPGGNGSAASAAPWSYFKVTS